MLPLFLADTEVVNLNPSVDSCHDREHQDRYRKDTFRRIPKRVSLSPKPPPSSHQKNLKIRENPKNLKNVEGGCLPRVPLGLDNEYPMLPAL